MSRARNLANLLNSSGDVKSDRLSNVPVYANASSSADGLLTKEDKSKLDGIATAATANGTVTGSGTTSGTNTGDNTVCTSGTATTATTLETARTINGVSFNGSANITVADSTKLPTAGGTMTGDTAHGDNVKAKFGASNDLQIYHDGSNSYIKDSGVGGLRLLADADTVIRAADNSTARASFGGDVKLYHNGSVKLATTSTGVSVTGDMTASGNVTAYSDERLKSSVETIPDALSKVLSVRGVTFTMNGERGTGVIAQELEQVLPEAVFDNEDGMKSVAYGNITGLLIEAIKELSAKVEELENK